MIHQHHCGRLSAKRRIFSSRGQQHRKILVGVFPKREELLILRSTLLNIACVCLRAPQPEMRKRKQRRERIDSPMGEDVSILSGGVIHLASPAVRLSSLGKPYESPGQFIRSGRLQRSNRVQRFVSLQSNLRTQPRSIGIHHQRAGHAPRRSIVPATVRRTRYRPT